MTKLEEDYAELARHRRELQALMDSEGWKIFCSYMAQAQEPLQAAILTPLKSQEEVYLREFQKGHRYAIQVIPGYPEAFIADIQTAMDAMQLDLEMEAKEDSDERADAPAGMAEGAGWGGDGLGDGGAGGVGIDADGDGDRIP